MTYLVAGLLLFLGVHSIAIVAPAWRDAQVARLGDAAWKAFFALASVIGFVMLVHGYGVARADPTILYTPPAAMRHVAKDRDIDMDDLVDRRRVDVDMGLFRMGREILDPPGDAVIKAGADIDHQQSDAGGRTCGIEAP